MILRITILIACCWVVASMVVGAAPTQSAPPLVVGFADDLPMEMGVQATDPARSLGASALRLTTKWRLGQ